MMAVAMNKKLVLACLLAVGAACFLWKSPPSGDQLRVAAYLLLIWIAGAIVTTPTWCFLSGFRNDYFGPTSPQRTTPQRIRAFAMGMLPLFLRDLFIWPIALYQALEFGLPPVLTRIGLRPAWTELSGGEKDKSTWTTRDGRKFYAGVSGIYSRDPATITAEWPSGAVAFRVRRLAPVAGEFTDWRPMERMSMNDWAEIVETREELNEPRPFESEIVIRKRGKFLVEFRVETGMGQFEEFSGLTLILT